MAEKPEKKFPQGKKRKKLTGIAEKVINIMKILNLIERGRHPNVKQLAEKLEVSERSVYRYLYIINQIVPIVYDQKLGGYRFENPDARRVIFASNKEVALVLSLDEFLRRASPSLSKIFRNLINKAMIAGERAEHKPMPILFSNLQGSSVDREKFDLITDAILSKEQLRIKYHSINTKELTERLIDPYGLIFHDNLWFLYAYCHLREDYRTFALDRIREIENIGTKFEIVQGFSLRERLSRSWFIWEAEPVKVRVKFSSDIAEFIKRKPKWHPSEERVENPDGTVELRFTVSGKDEIKWWLYSWLPHIELLEPESLKEEMTSELSRAIKKLESQNGNP